MRETPFPSLLYNITHHCNKPALSIIFLFAREKSRKSKIRKHKQCSGIKNGLYSLSFLYSPFKLYTMREMTLILRQQTSGPMPEDG